MRAPDTKGDYQPLGPSDRQLADAKTKEKPADVVKNVKPGVRTRNGKFETCDPKNDAAKVEWAMRQAARLLRLPCRNLTETVRDVIAEMATARKPKPVEPYPQVNRNIFGSHGLVSGDRVSVRGLEESQDVRVIGFSSDKIAVCIKGEKAEWWFSPSDVYRSRG